MGSFELLKNSALRSSTSRFFRVFVLAVTTLSIWAIVCGGWSKIPGDAGDGRFNLYILEHVSRYFLNPTALWNPGFFYPIKGVGGFSDLHLGSFYFYGFGRLFGYSPFVSMQLWMVTGILLNSFSAYYVARKWQLGYLASLLVGIIFSSSLPMTQLAGHAQLVHRWATPLAIYYFIVFLKKRKMLDSTLLIATAFLSLQFLCSPNLGVSLFLLLGSLFCVRRIFSTDTTDSGLSGKYLFALIVGSITIIIFTALVAYKYSVIKNDFGLTRSADEIMSFTPSFGNLLVADHSDLWREVSRNFGNVAGRGEAMMFTGILTSLALVLSARYRDRLSSLSRGLLTSQTIMFLVIVQIGTTSLLSIVSFLPGIDSLRTPGRVILVMLFPIAIVVSQGIERIRWAYFPLICLIFMGFEFTQVTTGLSTEDQWMAPVYQMEQQMQADSQKPFLVLDSPERNSYLLDLDAMLVSSRQHRETLNGYSGFIPIGWEDIKNCDDVRKLIDQINTITGRQLNMSDIEVVPLNCP